MRHGERHRPGRIGWLRATVLGANDGIVSTASLVVGVAAASAGRNEVIVAGVAGLVAGALSMAAGEYVSVSSQADAERAELALETVFLAPPRGLALVVSAASLICRAALGAVAGRVGGASAWVGAARVAFWSALALAVTAGVEAPFGAPAR
jgi:VIT1/CCC1 family predicted Fe2+/Mn2+ transporter